MPRTRKVSKPKFNLASSLVSLKQKSGKLSLVIIALSVLVFTTSSVVQLSYLLQERNYVSVYQEDYQAVFLTNGQVYFGKITAENSDRVIMTDIYYLQVTAGQQNAQQSAALASETGAGGEGATDAAAALQQTDRPANTSEANAAAANPNITLIKLGNELHGPTDMLVLTRNNVLFTEDLRANSQVVEAIKAQKQQQASPAAAQ